MIITFSPSISKKELDKVLLFHMSPRRLKVNDITSKSTAKFTIDPCAFNSSLFSCIQKGIFIDRHEIICPVETIGVSVFEQYERAIATSPINKTELFLKFSWEHEKNGHPSLVVYNDGLLNSILTSAITEMQNKIKFSTLGGE